MCSAPGIPAALHTNGRAADNTFGFDEKLFRRYKETAPPADWEESNALSANVFRLDSDSYNRSKYSAPLDVLFNIDATSESQHFLNYGVVQIECSLLQKSFDAVINKENKSYSLSVVHTPNDCIYAHCDVKVYDVLTNEIVDSKPPTIKSAIRRYLAKHKVIIKEFTPAVPIIVQDKID